MTTDWKLVVAVSHVVIVVLGSFYFNVLDSFDTLIIATERRVITK